MNATVPRGARVMLIASLLTVGFMDYWDYSRSFYAQPGLLMDIVRGTADAPQQYRVGVVRAGYWMTQHLHMAMRHAFALIDITALLIAVLLLLRLLERGEVFQRGSRVAQWFGAAVFLVLVQFYLAWLWTPQRVETLPACLMVASMLWLWQLPQGSAGKSCAIAGSLVVVVLVGSFVRADVAGSLSLGFFCVALTPLGKRFSLPQGLALGTSAVLTVVAGGVQLYLMKVAYPLAGYGRVKMWQFRPNLIHGTRWVPFVLFMLPVLWTYVQVIRRRLPGDAVGVALMAGAVPFAALWAVIGKVDEVRIFLPIALAMVPVTVQMAMLQAGEAQGSASQLGTLGKSHT